MISEKNKNKAELYKSAVTNSELDPTDKELLIDFISDSLDATNGYTQEEKLQKTTENQFTTALILSRLLCKKHETKSWKDVVMNCRNQIVIIALFISCVLVFRPEIASVIGVIIGK